MRQAEQGPDGNADTGWAQGIRRGDPEAFRRIYEELVPQLLKIAYGYVRSKVDAEEIVQDVTCRVWENHGHFDPAGQVARYLRHAVRNRALDTLEQRRTASRFADRLVREQAVEQGGPAIPGATDADMVEEAGERGGKLVAQEGRSSHEFWDAYEQAIDRLPPRCREVYLLRGAEVPRVDIAHVLGISVHTVDAQIGRALRILRTELRDWRP